MATSYEDRFTEDYEGNESSKRFERNRRGQPAPAAAPTGWLTNARKHQLKEGFKEFMLFEAVQLVVNHFGYVGIVSAGYLFKLALAASLASYFAFLSAAVVGGLVTFFPTMLIQWALEKYTNLDNDVTGPALLALHIGAAPVVGAWLLNLTLGWSLALVPMLAVSGVGFAIGILLIAGLGAYNKYQASRERAASQQPSSADRLSASAVHQQGIYKPTDRDEHGNDKYTRTTSHRPGFGFTGSTGSA